MRVIVCGAGQVGYSIAQYLSAEGNSVTVIEQDAELAARLAGTLDAHFIHGHASHPEVLEQADAANAEMIVAVTQDDEVNIVACQVAHTLFEVPTKIARVRHQSFLRPAWANLFSPENIPIDTIISPEIEVARTITARLHVPGCYDAVELAAGKVHLLGVNCTPTTPILDTPLRQLRELFSDIAVQVMCIIRQDRPILPTADEHLLADDAVYLAVATEQIPRVMKLLGHTEAEARRVIIAGGGNVGLHLAEAVEKEFPNIQLRIIERNPDRAGLLATTLRDAIVLQGDVLDMELLEEAHVRESEAIICVTDDDETNILSSLLAKRHGCQRAITLVNKASYSPLLGNLGINAVVNPRAITVSRILQQVRRGRVRAVYSLRDGFGEVMECEVLEGSPLANIPLGDVRLPEGVVLGLIVRGDEIMRPQRDVVIRAHDHVILLSTLNEIRTVERLFAMRADYF